MPAYKCPRQVDVGDHVALVPEDLPDQTGPGLLALAGDCVEEELPLLGDRAERARGTAGRVEALHPEAGEGVPVVEVEPEQGADGLEGDRERDRSEEHTSELQ